MNKMLYVAMYYSSPCMHTFSFIVVLSVMSRKQTAMSISALPMWVILITIYFGIACG